VRDCSSRGGAYDIDVINNSRLRDVTCDVVGDVRYQDGTRRGMDQSINHVTGCCADGQTDVDEKIDWLGPD